MMSNKEYYGGKLVSICENQAVQSLSNFRRKEREFTINVTSTPHVNAKK